MTERIAVIGLGYVGLPLALAVARKFPGTVGFDINAQKLDELRKGVDRTREVSAEDLKATTLKFSSSIDDLADRTFFIVAVPTPIDQQKRPDLVPLVKASETVGKALKPGAIVVFESTVYPGVTEEVCCPVLERVSKLKRGQFKLGYSPERINPGDREHTLERITKVVSGEDAETLERVAAVYSRIVPAGVFKATSIRVAEAAKVIENTQRDLNIALMNELALIFDRMGIRTKDVLAAAGTKWNFLPFKPGLVGGHCIGVDPYYLTAKAEEHGYRPEVILAGRRINDSMGRYVADKAVKLLSQGKIALSSARVGIFGVTFKENVPDLRNSRVVDIIAELKEYGIQPLVHDPLADAHEAKEEMGVELTPWDSMTNLDAVILAVSHRQYVEMGTGALLAPLKDNGVLIDIKAAIDPAGLKRRLAYWSL
ncbi:MAG TPA: nucleotide sugar dehydrogenase [Planctomycetota bacterium]|nr:nucleotide sugar dehydrogenase [Planctomycetota bacterium]